MFFIEFKVHHIFFFREFIFIQEFIFIREFVIIREFIFIQEFIFPQEFILTREYIFPPEFIQLCLTFSCFLSKFTPERQTSDFYADQIVHISSTNVLYRKGKLLQLVYYGEGTFTVKFLY